MQTPAVLESIPRLLPVVFRPSSTPPPVEQKQKGVPSPRQQGSPAQQNECILGGSSSSSTTGIPEPSQKSNGSTKTRAYDKPSQALPVLPPVELPAPLNVRRKAAAVPRDNIPAGPRANKELHTRSSSRTSHTSTSSVKSLRQSTTELTWGPATHQRVWKHLGSPQGAEYYANRALPATPDSPTLASPDLWQPVHDSGRTSKFGKAVVSKITTPPSPPISPDAAFIASVDATSMDAQPLPSLLTEVLTATPPDHPAPDFAAHDSDPKQSDRTRTMPKPLSPQVGGLSLVVSSPENTAWQRTAYVPGPIKIQKPGTIPNTPLSPIDFCNNGFGLGPDAATNPRNSLADLLFDDDASSSRHRRGEEIILAEVAQYIETFGFDPVTFDGDEFWLDDREDLRAAHRQRSSISGKRDSATSAELPIFLSSNPPSNGDNTSGTLADIRAASSTSRRRSSNTSRRASGHNRPTSDPVPSSRGHAQGVSPHSTRTGFSLSPTSMVSTSRHSPSSPAKPDAMSDKERKAALKRMGGGGGGISNKVGFMRLLRGASGIV